MEVRRSRHGKVALVIGGNTIIKYVSVDGNSPKFYSAHYREFNSEFNKKLELTAEQAALSFLKVAKRAFKHNGDVIKFLMEEILMKNISEMTLDEIVSRYNELAVAANKPTRKSFSSKKAALEALEKLDAEVKVATPEQVQAAEKSTQRRSNNMSENGETKEVKQRGKGIGAMAMDLLLQGKGTKEVIDAVKEAIPDANPTPATIAWYKNKLRQEGKLPKPERKAKADKKATKEADTGDTGEGESEGEGEGENGAE